MTACLYLLCFVCAELLSCVQPFVTIWTVAARLLCPWASPVKNAGVGCCLLLQGIFPTQGLNLRLPCLLQCRQILHPPGYGG